MNEPKQMGITKALKNINTLYEGQECFILLRLDNEGGIHIISTGKNLLQNNPSQPSEYMG